VGAFPSKVTVPVTVEAAMATPGQTDIATSTAASRIPYPVPRMLGSFARLVAGIAVDEQCVNLEKAEVTPSPPCKSRSTSLALGRG
jgi:hypothetical protein